MSYKNKLAALLLTTSLIAAPALATTCYAQDGQPSGERKTEWRHHAPFTDAQRQLIHGAMQKLHHTNKPLYEELKRLHSHLRDVMQADQFDQQTFLSLTNKIDAKKQEMKHNKEQAFASIAGQFPPEQRRHLAHWFMHKRHHSMHGGWQQGDHRDGERGGWQQGDRHDGWREDGHEGRHHPDDSAVNQGGWDKNDGPMQELNDTGGGEPMQNGGNSPYPPYNQQ